MRTLALWALLLCVYGAVVLAHGSPERHLTAGEAHVLLTAESIVSDADLDVSNQYAHRAWRSWYPHALRPTAKPDGAGRMFEPQGAGFPLLLAPAWAIGGVTAVHLWLAALLAAAFACAARLALRLVPDPWAHGAALIGGLSAPALAASTAIRPEAAAAAALAGAAVLALSLRDAPRTATAFWGALLVALVPWIALSAVLPAVAIALAMAHWLRRRARGTSGLAALEVVLMSAVVFVTIAARLYGGLTPYASRRATGPLTGVSDVGDVLSRLGRLGTIAFDVVASAPFALVAALSLALLWRSRRTGIARLAAERIDVEVVTGFLALACAAQVVAAAFLAPGLHGPWFDTRFLVPVLPLGAALAAWGFQRRPRVAGALGLLTVGIGAWYVVALLAGLLGGEPVRSIGL